MLNPEHKLLIERTKNLLETQKFNEAKRSLGELFEYDNKGPALLLAGKYHRLVGEYQKSAFAFETVLKSIPNHSRALHGFAYASYVLGRFEVAEESFQKVINKDGEKIGTLLLLASCKMDMGKRSEAVHLFEKIILLKPDNYSAIFRLIQCRIELCDWRKRRQDKDLLVKSLTALFNGAIYADFIPMYTLNYFDLSPELHLKAAQFNAGIAAGRAKNIAFAKPVGTAVNNKIRIGYLSPDLREHAVGILMHQIFQHHDKETFETFAYSLVRSKDSIQEQIITGVNHFTDVSEMATPDIALKIASDNIDILIDLAGYSRHARPELMALPIAKAKAHYLGYSDTMGADFVPYMIADQTIVPEKLRPFYTEKVIDLPYNFCVSPIAPILKTREEFGLPDDVIIYSSFNSSYKIDPIVLDSWCKILTAVEGSVLLLARASNDIQSNLLREVEQRGISKDRVIFAKNRLELGNYLGLLACTDVFLDTFNYNAGSTAACAAMANVPLITLTGAKNASRMGSSINSSLGLVELNCSSPQVYEELAISIGQDHLKRDKLKTSLQISKDTSPTFKPEMFVTQLEKAYNSILTLCKEYN